MYEGCIAGVGLAWGVDCHVQEACGIGVAGVSHDLSPLLLPPCDRYFYRPVTVAPTVTPL